MIPQFREFQSDPTFSGKTKQPAVDASRNNTDVIAPEFKLYIEGVQVPFESISVNQYYTGLPSADIQVPPQSGLLDIIRGYEPKVHIFYRDDNYGGDRLLFWGVIKANSYSRSRREGSTYITFRCVHKNSAMSGLTLDFTGWASPTNTSQTDANPNSAYKPGAFNSMLMIVDALTGVNGIGDKTQSINAGNPAVADAPTDKLDASLSKFQSRLVGMPGVAVNLWNQIRKGSYSFRNDSLALSKMYIPLIDEGLSYFKRMSGHPVLENRLQTGKFTYCNQRGYKESDIIIPPAYRNSFQSAIQGKMAVEAIANRIGFSGEFTTFPMLLNQFFYDACQYDILTLASPAEVSLDPSKFVDDINQGGVEKSTIETILKPQIPFYFSPICNVILPRMYSAININQDESAVPTRVSAAHDAMPAQNGTNSLNTSFKSPASFREATAYNSYLKTSAPENGGAAQGSLNLESTKGLSYFIPSKYEQGIGIRHQKIMLPWWLVILATDKSSQGATLNQEALPAQGTPEYLEMITLAAEWKSRYGKNIKESDATVTSQYNVLKDGLNPYDPNNTSVLPHERIMYATADYEYSQKVASSRNGNVEAIFNPYVIPGYPIDIIDDSPNHPSFHAFCTSVTHTISSRSVSTSIGIINAVSYAELSNYYIPPLPPFLNTTLNLVNSEVDLAELAKAPKGSTDPILSTASVLIQNPKAKATADTFYREVLGVGAAAPDDLIHFVSNRAYPLERKAGILIPKITPDSNSTPNVQSHAHRAKETDDYYSVVGNLRLVARPIESKESIESKFQYTFIDLNPLLYNNIFVNYVNPKLAMNLFLEPGASLFLDYLETEEFIKI